MSKIVIFLNKLAVFIITLIIFLSVVRFAFSWESNIDKQIELQRQYKIELEAAKDSLLTAESIFTDSLIAKMDNYIDSLAPSSKMKGEYIFNCSQQYNISIPFMMAQAQHESMFATTGAGKRYNNPYNIGSYDNGQRRGFKTLKDATDTYAEIISSDYLIDGKTEHDLLVNFVNKNGHRYASNPKYERQLKHTKSKIETYIKPELDSISVIQQKISLIKLELDYNQDVI